MPSEMTSYGEWNAPARKPSLSLRALLEWNFEHSHLGVAIHRQGRLVRANRAYADLFGYSNEELTNLSVEDLTHPDDLQASLEQIDRVRRGETRSFVQEKRYLRADGSVFTRGRGWWAGTTPTTERIAPSSPSRTSTLVCARRNSCATSSKASARPPGSRSSPI